MCQGSEGGIINLPSKLIRIVTSEEFGRVDASSFASELVSCSCPALSSDVKSSDVV